MYPFRIAEPYDTMTLRLLPYDEVAAYLHEQLQRYRPSLLNVLDIACGTGNLSLALARLGYQVCGLDISSEMLALAKRKAAAKKLDVSFVHHDMQHPYPGEQAEAITCFYGGFNFLLSTEAVKQAFKAAYAALLPGGLLAFDQFSETMMRAIYNDLKAADFEDFYIVTRSQCNTAGYITHEVTYFLKETDGRYRREEELQLMRIHPFADLKTLLAETGFTILAIEPLAAHIKTQTLQDVFLFLAQKPGVPL